MVNNSISGVKTTKKLSLFRRMGLKVDDMRIKAIKRSKKGDRAKVEMAIKIKNDSKKIEALELFSEDEDKQEIAITIKDDDKKIEAISLIEDEHYKTEIALTIKDDDKKMESLSFLETDYYKADVASSIKDANKKIEVLPSMDSDWGKAFVIASIKEDNKRIELIDIVKEKANQEYIVNSLDVFKDVTESGPGRLELIRTVQNKGGEQDVAKEIKQRIIEANRIKKIKNDSEKIEAIKKMDSVFLMAETVSSIKDDDIKIEMLSLFDNDWSKELVIKNIKDENKKLAALNLIEEDYYKLEIVETFEDDNAKIEAIKLMKDEGYKAQVAALLTDDNKKIQSLTILDDAYAKKHVIETIKDTNLRLESVSKYYTYDMLIHYIDENKESKLTKNPKFKELRKTLEEVEKIKDIKDDNKKTEFINSIDNENLKIEVIKTMENDEKKMELLEQLTAKSILEYRKTSGDIEFIKKNIEKFIEKEGFKGKIPEGILDELYEKNNSVVQGIDFRLLDPKYIDLLGKDKINLISCYEKIQEDILLLSDKQIYVFSKCIDNYTERMKTDEWTVLAKEMLENLSRGEYDILLDNIGNLDELEQEDFEKLTYILQSDNWCKITDINQVRDFEKIREQRCNEIMQNENASIQEKREAVIQKIFGHGYQYAKSVIIRFGEDINNINEGDAKDYVTCLKLIEEVKDPSILKQIFEQCDFVKTDKIIIERTLKNEYGKLFNEGLYVPTEKDLVDGYQNVYEVGTEFKMIMTSLGPYCTNEAQNYKEDWNRPAISTQHFCASYIRNDMIGTAVIKSICYGFVDMKEDALMLSGNKDIFSTIDTFESRANWHKNEIYYTPEQQINHTNHYNEIDFRRIQGGEKKQPDYIVVFRRNGEIPNMMEAQKASEQWGGMPIVVVDVDKCLDAEREKVSQMMEKYEQQPSTELANQIKQKVRNNRVTDSEFCTDINEILNVLGDEQKILEKTSQQKKETILKKVTEEDLKENHEEVRATERKCIMNKMQQVLKRTKQIVRGVGYEKRI